MPPTPISKWQQPVRPFLTVLLLFLFLSLASGYLFTCRNSPLMSWLGVPDTQDNYTVTPRHHQPGMETGEMDDSKWQTYRNTTYNFELKYPRENTEIREDKNNNPLLQIIPLPQPVEFGPQLLVSADAPLESPTISVNDLKHYLSTILQPHYAILN